VALVSLATDNLVRSHPAASFRGLAATAPFILLPSLLVLAAGLLSQQVAEGHWAWVAVALVTPLLGATAYAEYLAVEGPSGAYQASLLFLHGLAYITAFAAFAFIEASLPLPLAVPATGVIATLLAVELLRVAPFDTVRHLASAAIIGLISLEASLGLGWLPLDTFPAALLLLLFFYLTTGLVLSYRRDRLSWGRGPEFGAVGVLGLALVIIASLLF